MTLQIHASYSKCLHMFQNQMTHAKPRRRKIIKTTSTYISLFKICSALSAVFRTFPQELAIKSILTATNTCFCWSLFFFSYRFVWTYVFFAKHSQETNNRVSAKLTDIQNIQIQLIVLCSRKISSFPLTLQWNYHIKVINIILAKSDSNSIFVHM